MRQRVKGIITIAVAVSLVSGFVGFSTNHKFADADSVKSDYIISVSNEDVAEKVASKLKNKETDTENDEGCELLEESGLLTAKLTSAEAKRIDSINGVNIEKNVEVSLCDTDDELTNATSDEIVEVIESKWNIKATNTEDATSTEAKRIKVAIIDSGVDVTPDIDIKERIDLVNDDSLSYLCEDMTGHGTSVAGIMSAKKNDEGTSGVNSGLDLTSIKVFDQDNTAPLSRIIAGLEWCIENDIDVVNMSFGLKTDSEIFHDVIKRACDKNILLVAAAGNHGSQGVEYPAAYDEVVCVGSINSEGELSEFSAKGDEVEIVAPGEDVPVTGMLGFVGIESGTSLAAPHVCAVAASIWENHPDWNAEKIRALLQKSALHIDDENTGFGVVDYQYAKSIEDSFDDYYEEGSGISDDCISENSKTFERYELPDAVASWNESGHNGLINYADDRIGSGKYGQKRLKRLKEISLYVDQNNTCHSINTLHACESTNYIAAVACLYRVAYLQKTNLDEDTISIFNQQKNSFGFENGEIDDLSTAISMIINKDYEILYSGEGSVIRNKRKDYALRILGLALHIGGDAFAHKAQVSSEQDVNNKLASNAYLYFRNWNYVKNEINAGGLTTSRLSNLAKEEYVGYVHRETADNTSFMEKRYLYGARHVVKVLMSQYYNKEAKFNIRSFCNYGYANNKNNVKQHKLCTHAKDVYAAQGGNYSESAWEQASFSD